jgi:hypothetical protein
MFTSVCLTPWPSFIATAEHTCVSFILLCVSTSSESVHLQGNLRNHPCVCWWQ